MLGVGCALLAITFCVVVHQTGHWYAHTFRNPYLRAVVGGVLVVAISLLEGSGDYNGAGGHIIALAVDEGTVHVPWAFALKLLLTALTLGAGYRGGEIVPPSLWGPPSAVPWPRCWGGPGLRGGGVYDRTLLWRGKLPPGQHLFECGAVRQ